LRADQARDISDTPVTTLFYIAAGLGGLILVLQVASSLLGIVDHSVADGQLEEGLDLLSVRALSAGLAFLGIGGLAGIWIGLHPILALPIGIVAGGAALIATAKVTRAILRLESDRTPAIEETIGEKGTVYLTIPGGESGLGKVHVPLRGRLVELAAITKSDTIPTGAAIEVVDTVGETVVVAPLTFVE